MEPRTRAASTWNRPADTMRILHAIHDFLPRHQAGSEIYALNLARAQRALGLHTHVLCTDDDRKLEHGSYRWRMYEGVGVTELINNWAFPSFRDTYRSPLLNQRLRDLLMALAPDVLHIHNLLNLSFDLPVIAHELGIPTVATLHDYTLVCASGGQRVHEAEGHICTLIDTRRCERCFAQHNFFARSTFGPMALERVRPMNPRGRMLEGLRYRAPFLFGLLARALQRPGVDGRGVSAAQMDERLEDVQRVFDATDLFIAPSPNLAAEYVRLGLPAGKLRVSDYGFIRFVPVSRRRSDRLRIGFVGTLVWHKGAHVLLEAVRSLPLDRFEVIVYGDTSTFPDYVAGLRESARGLPVTFKGRFERNRVPDVYASLDVLVVPSLWPENSPLVIHEAFMAGAPVVGSRQGGTQDLVTHDVNGLLYDAYSPGSLAAALQSLIDKPGLLDRLAAAVPEVKSIHEDASEFEGIYKDLTRRKSAGGPAPAGAATTRPTAAVLLNNRASEAALLALQSLEASRQPPRDVFVVDASPEDRAASVLISRVPQDHLIVGAPHMSMAGTCNLGLRAAMAGGAQRILIMNGDSVLSPGTLPLLERALDADPQLGIVGPTICFKSDPGVIHSRGIQISTGTGRVHFLSAGQRVAPLPDDERTVPVDAVSGCVVLVRRDVFERIGLLSEDYELGLHDVDFCVRARAAGYTCGCVAAATALHEATVPDADHSADGIYFSTRNHLLLASRLSSRPSPLTWSRAGRIAMAHFGEALFRSEVPIGAGLRAVAGGVRDHLRGRYGPLRMTGMPVRKETARSSTAL